MPQGQRLRNHIEKMIDPKKSMTVEAGLKKLVEDGTLVRIGADWKRG